MKKLVISMLLAMAFHLPLKSLVDFGGTWVAPVAIFPACLGQEFVNVGFHVNWEVNNSSFLIQRSTDPQFNWAINLTTITGGGTCGSSIHSFNDNGPFQPGQVWYYRVRATSNSLNMQHQYLGSYTCNLPTIVNWVSQVSNQFMTGASPSTESSYSWFQESRSGQGVNISLIPTEIANIYVEQNNHKINFMSHAGSPFLQLEVNINNGGYSTIHSGSGVTSHTWNSVGIFNNLTSYNLKVKYTLINSTIYYREYNIQVVPASDGLYLDNFCNSIRVWKGNDPVNGTPLILSEGFDAYNSKPQQYYRESGKDLINCLLKKGFNVYIVDYNLNSQSILNNAAVFQSAIRYVSSLNGNRNVVATGISMGGIINRYACAQAESVSNPLPISKMVCIDAPHQGGVISPAMQDWRKANTSDPFEVAASNNDAAKQLLLYNAYDITGLTRSMFNLILNSVNSDGYPHLVEKIGVAFSNNSPNPNSGNWLSVVPSAAQSPISFAMSNNEMQAGSYLPRLTIDPLHFYLPLVRIVVNITQTKDPCFIPHNSALDIVNGVSKFDKVIFPTVTDFHDKIPSSIVEEIVNVLLEDVVNVQNKTIASGRNTIARKKINSGQNVTAQLATGPVNITSINDVVFKAGEEIALQDGFQSISGSEFAAIIGPVQCDNSLALQNKSISNQPEYSEYPNSSLPPLLPENLQIEYYNPSQSHTDNSNRLPEVLPNPTEGLVYLSGFKAEALQYEVLSLDNKILKSGQCNTRIINLEEFSRGLYILRIQDEKAEMHVFKIIRN